MLRKEATIEQIAKDVVNYLGNYININKLILFGSYAYGRPREDSDFDFAIISDDLAGMNYFERMKLFAKTALSIDARLELQGYSKQEYDDAPAGSFIRMIRDQGKEFKIPIY